MYPPEQFTKQVGEVRGSFVTYKRNGRGGLDMTFTLLDDDKHDGIDLVDGGEFIHLLKVYAVPRDDDE